MVMTTEERIRAITLLEEGYSSREVTSKLSKPGKKIHHTSILRLKKKYEETGSVKNKQVSGRPRKLTKRDERTVVRRILKDECSTASEIQRSLKVHEKIEVSSNTVRKVLKRNGFVARVKQKKPLLSKTHQKTRLEFAEKYKYWTVEDWNKVVWSDESKFQIFRSDGRTYC